MACLVEMEHEKEGCAPFQTSGNFSIRPKKQREEEKQEEKVGGIKINNLKLQFCFTIIYKTLKCSHLRFC
jgi:hypothetical protein